MSSPETAGGCVGTAAADVIGDELNVDDDLNEAANGVKDVVEVSSSL